MKQVIRDNIVMLLMAHMVMLAEPALLHAEGNYHPVNFTEPLKTERGELAPIGRDAIYLTEADACAIAKQDWGWADCGDIDQIAVGMGPDIDTMILSKPVSDGYVKLDDLLGSDADTAINEITNTYKESLANQSQRTGRKIEFAGWRFYPKADHTRNLIYFALDTRWDGELQTTIRAMLLDRYGYVVMNIITIENDLDAGQIERVLNQAIAAYTPKPMAAYTAHEKGDKIAAYGGLGVLATVLGVKYGKAASVGVIAIVALVLKKAWFLILLPFIALRGVFRRLFGRSEKTGA
jgi:uncharacterized membrane-anchored protein